MKEVGLKREVPFGRPMIDQQERAAVEKVLSGDILVHGPVAKEFEKRFSDYTGAASTVSVSSCTAGMHLIYHALGYGPGDEVIVPAQTHVATAHAVQLTGATPVFVDAEPETGNIDVTKIEAVVNEKTRAIALVHYLGVPADMEDILAISKKYDLFVLEDCALAPGAFYAGNHAGLIGDAGVFSFYPVKHITTGEGGVVITKHQHLADRLNLLKAFGIDKNHGERKQQGSYDAIELGFNYRMSEIHAAIGVEQIKKLDNFLDARRKNFEYLESAIDSIPSVSAVKQPIDETKTSSHYCLSMVLDDRIVKSRAEIMQHLKLNGVGSSIYYPEPVPRMSYYKNKYGYDSSRFKNAEKFSDSTIALPVGPHLDQDDMDFVARQLEIAIGRVL